MRATRTLDAGATKRRWPSNGGRHRYGRCATSTGARHRDGPRNAPTQKRAASPSASSRIGCLLSSGQRRRPIRHRSFNVAAVHVARAARGVSKERQIDYKVDNSKRVLRKEGRRIRQPRVTRRGGSGTCWNHAGDPSRGAPPLKLPGVSVHRGFCYHASSFKQNDQMEKSMSGRELPFRNYNSIVGDRLVPHPNDAICPITTSRVQVKGMLTLRKYLCTLHVFHCVKRTIIKKKLRGARCKEGRQCIHTALSHSANAENMSRQRTMAIRGRRLKSALQRILRLISIVDRPFAVCDQTNGRKSNENVVCNCDRIL
ncbi:hypothetical protein ALC62_02037 [Cyphomyrmex costatus]|uniref:Uncharacterized protein n=1 Tax=Cyphomyrmex costatus TaxID=456900 RepID=A0A151ING8_9HYME|nr:hypothetical protein ALC62_02037 [Cyphomyrmex costatus]